MNDDTLLLYFLLVVIKYSLLAVVNPNQPTEVLLWDAEQFPWWSPLSSPPYKWFPWRTSLLDHCTASLLSSLIFCTVDCGGYADQWDPSQSGCEPMISLCCAAQSRYCWKWILLVIDVCDPSDIFNPFPCGFMFSVGCLPLSSSCSAPSQVNMREGTSRLALTRLAGPEIFTWAHLGSRPKPFTNVPSGVALQQTQLNTTNLWPPVVLVKTQPAMLYFIGLHLLCSLLGNHNVPDILDHLV